MKVLLVNKLLSPKGGAETYVFKLGEALTAHGHQVEYFGLENEKKYPWMPSAWNRNQGK